MRSLILLTLSSLVVTGATLRPVELKCEYLKNPLGIDVRKPRLNWQLVAIDAAARNLSQSAYRVLVATSAEKLTAGQGDLWDSGRVAGAQSVHVEYAGKALPSGQAAYWKVRVWDAKGAESDWSEPALAVTKHSPPESPLRQPRLRKDTAARFSS